MQINTDIYPEVNHNTYAVWSNEVTDYDPTEELEHSIFYAGTYSENLQFSDSSVNHYNSVPPNCKMSCTPHEKIKGDVYFQLNGTRLFNFIGTWETRNDNVCNIVTSFDVSKFYFDLDTVNCELYDISNPNGTVALAAPITMSFKDYRSQPAGYKKTHLIRRLSYTMIASDSTSLCKYKDEEDYTAVGVVPMVRYKINEDSVIYSAPNLTNGGVPNWNGPVRLANVGGSGEFPNMNGTATIYDNSVLMNGEWYSGFTSGSAARPVTSVNCGKITDFTVHAVAGQVNYGYDVPSLDTIDTDKYGIPFYQWVLSNYTKQLEHLFTDEYVMRYFASFGLRFKVDNVMYIGYMDSQGCCIGDYILESELADSDSANKNITDFTGSAYDANVPYIPPEPGPSWDDDETPYTDAYGTAYGSIEMYGMTGGQLNDLLDAMNSNNVPAGFDTANAIVGLKRFPFSLSDFCTATTTPIEWVYRYDAQGEWTRTIWPTGGASYPGYKLARNFRTLDLGSINITRFWPNIPFINHQITASLYIPFCGMNPVNIEQVLGKTITIKLTVDITTGTCVGHAYSDNHLICNSTGICGVDLPISIQNYGSIKASIINNQKETAYNIGSAVAGIAGSIMSGGSLAPALVPMVTNQGFNLVGKMLNARTINNSLSASVSASSGSMADWALPMTPFIELILPKPHNDQLTGYGSSHSFLKCETVSLSDCGGLTMCNNPQVDTINKATDAEKAEIYNYLQNGVIL